MHRTHTCGELTAANIGNTVTLSGWVHNLRDMGGLVFIDLRDRYGVTQVSYNPSDEYATPEITSLLNTLKNEYCIKVTGEVIARPEGQANKDMATGEIEISLRAIEVLTKSKVLPFPIVDDPATSEENRFKHRFLDLRRRPVLDNLEFRSRMTSFTRQWFTERGFLDIQTPILTVSSPEGARDYVIPSRIQPGKFYALPQSPQQYKQLLMVGGLDRYFQIAPCFRDEDPRADRAMCEFYQVDLEMSFVEQEDVLEILRGYALAVAEHLTPHKQVTHDFVRLSYHDAMNRWGTDRPDLRFGMEIVDLSEELANSEFGVFKNTIADGGVVRAIRLEQQTMSRKELDEITDVAKRAGAGGLAYLIYENGEVRSPIAKFLSEAELQTIAEKTGATDGDILFFGAGSWSLVCKVLDKVRLFLRDKYELVNNDELAFAFVLDFPFYEYNETSEKWDFGHNPFSHVVGGLDALANKETGEIMTNQYDVILNGYEIGGGSIRNHDPEVMVAAFEKIGYGEQDIKDKFGAMYEAFQYGAPPHGGCAFGFDRFLMVLKDETNIRECYAFPKSGKAEDVLMGAPSTIYPQQLQELKIDVQTPEEN